MKVFVAGATGALGPAPGRRAGPPGPRRHGDDQPFAASTPGLEGTRRASEALGGSHSDAAAMAEEAVRQSGAEAVIDQLTSLPKSPADMAAARATDRRLRIEGGGNLRRAALACGARRYVSSSPAASSSPGEGWRTSPSGWRWTPALELPSTHGPTPSWRRGCWPPGRWRAWRCATRSSMGRAPGTAPRARAPTRLADRRYRS